MTIKDKLKSYNFWITLVSAIILLLQVFGEKFNFKIDSTFIIDVTTALCSIFVVLGIISVPKAKTTKTDIRIVEPNYDELCLKISNELSGKIVFNQTPENKSETNHDSNKTNEVVETKDDHFEECLPKQDIQNQEQESNNIETEPLNENKILETSQQNENHLTLNESTNLSVF